MNKETHIAFQQYEDGTRVDIFAQIKNHHLCNKRVVVTKPEGWTEGDDESLPEEIDDE